jgi:predicted dehydrogenase
MTHAATGPSGDRPSVFVAGVRRSADAPSKERPDRLLDGCSRPGRRQRVALVTGERNPPRILGIGLVGGGAMAKAHSLGYAACPMLEGPAIPTVDLVRLADIDATRAASAARRFGWRSSSTRWEDVTRADDVGLVDVATPNESHLEIVLDAVRHGKHVLCEKPLGPDARSARSMYEAARDARIVHQVGFVYRNWPAIRLARRLIATGVLGRLHHFRASCFHDYALDASYPANWRSQRSTAGGGSIVDLGSHLVDLARFLVGEIASVCAHGRTLHRERPAIETGRPTAVDVDDATDVLLKFSNGAAGVLQVSRVATGHKTHLSLELSGQSGAVRLDWSRSDELLYAPHVAATELDGFRSVVVGPGQQAAGGLWRFAGAGTGYSDAFVAQARNLLAAISADQPAAPDFLDGLRACEVIDAIMESSESGAWSVVQTHPAGGQR